MPASAQLTAYLRAVFTASPALGSAQAEYIINLGASMLTGIGDTQIDKAWGDTRTVASGTPDDLDFIGSAIKDAFGNNLAFAEVCGVLVAAEAANPGNIIVGAAAALATVLAVGAATHTRIVKPGGFDFWFAPTGWPVATGSTDVHRVASSSGSSIYSIIVLGRSA